MWRTKNNSMKVGRCEGVYKGHKVVLFLKHRIREEEYGIRSERQLRWQSREFELECVSSRESKTF